MSRPLDNPNPELEKINLLLYPTGPSWIDYSTDLEKLADDPTGETHDTFFDRLSHRLTDHELRLIERAYVFSKYGHRGQFRSDGSRYFNHARSVAIIILDELNCYQHPKLLCAALLHDIREDTRLLDAEIICKVFGKQVMVSVNYLTKDARRKQNYFKILIDSGDWMAMLIKCCDRLHNMRTVHLMPHEKVMKQIEETYTEFPALIAATKLCLPKNMVWMADHLDVKIMEVCAAQERVWQWEEANRTFVP